MRRFLRDETANILPLAAVGMLVAAMVVGSAIDLSRAYKVENRLQSACDSAVLAGRRSITTNGYDTAAENAANAYFNTNFDEAAQEAHSTAFSADSEDDGNTVVGTANTTVDTLIMRLFGFMDFDVAVTCTASMGVGNADVMMVLDTTGSMDTILSGSTTRIMALRTAMNNFYATLATATSGTNARVRYGFVPYSTTVNVGRLLTDLDPDYIVDSHTYQSREAQWRDETTSTQTGWTAGVTTTGDPTYTDVVDETGSWNDLVTGYTTNNACLAALPTVNADYVNNGTATSSSVTVTSAGQQVTTTTTVQPQRKITGAKCVSYKSGKNTRYKSQIKYFTRNLNTFVYLTKDAVYVDTVTTVFNGWQYKPVTYDTSAFKNFEAVTTNTGTNGTAVSSTWNGCIEERQTSNTATFSYSSITGMTPSVALDVNIDMEPTSDDTTKWAPLWSAISYVRNSTSDRTRNTTAVGVRTSTPCPAEAQSLSEMDSTSFSTYANSLVATGNTYLDIGMIWGGRMISPDGIFADTVNDAPNNGGEVSRHVIFMTDGIMEPNPNVHTAWGVEWWDRRVTSDGTTNNAARHTSRLRAVCDAIKDKGIRIWVIAFTSGLSTDLSYCASDDSSYTANNSTELNTAFQEIAKNVGELRITQ